jgi:hypothetical protein
MNIDNKHKLQEFPLTLKVIEAFDFREEPILLLERDTIGNNFLSYLVESNGIIEQRIYLQISKDRLGEIIEKSISIYEAFQSPENNHIYIAEFSLEFGNVLAAYILPAYEFLKINPINKNYDIDIELPLNNIVLDTVELLNYSERKNKLVFDFYLQSQNLINNIKPYAFYKIFTPIVEIIKSMLEFDNRNADKYLAFSNLRQSSLGITIEINYSNDLFLQKETEVLETIMQLLNAQEKDDFDLVISKSKNDKFIKEYSTIIKAVIDNDASLDTAYANPITQTIIRSSLDKERAQKAKVILDEKFDAIEDVEEIVGTFLEIDIDAKEPSFKIYSNEDSVTIKGKFELSILEKVKNDFVNIGKEKYKFYIKTLYYPETTVKSEEIKRFMINYEKQENGL